MDGRLPRVKIYQVLCHEVLFYLSRQVLGDMPSTIATMRTPEGQMTKLLQKWIDMDNHKELILIFCESQGKNAKVSPREL